MTAPRRVVAGATLMLSRRCLNRMFLLRPSKLGDQLLLFVLAVVSQRYRIQLHGYCVLSNHLHLVVTDPLGKSPEFMRDLCGLIARSFNAMHGRWESFWAPGSYSAVTLATPDDLIDKLAYVLANPVKAGLVRRGREWPGLWSAPERIGGPSFPVSHPGVFFRRVVGPMPEQASLSLACPPGFRSVEAFREALVEKVTALEDQTARERAKQGLGFLGVAKVLAQRPHARPASAEPRRRLNPRIAASDKWKRVEAIARLKTFLTEYRQAWQAFARGLREAVFPHGTYWMRVAHGVACAQAG